VSTIVITVDPTELDWLFAGTLQAMRQSMGITLTGLSNASGIPFTRLEVIESGGAATPAERHDITVALTSLSKTGWSRPAEHVPTALGGHPGGGPRCPSMKESSAAMYWVGLCVKVSMWSRPAMTTSRVAWFEEAEKS
jgi:hypothetical protein